MSPVEYERVVADLIRDLEATLPDLENANIGVGYGNRIQGSSGYRHQIDVSLKTDAFLLLIECKRWKDRVGVNEVLVLASRAADIRAQNPTLMVWPALVTTRGVTRDAPKLAESFRVGIDVVKNTLEYAIRIRHRVYSGVRSGVRLGDLVEAEVRKSRG
jgi:hypothetical protein